MQIGMISSIGQMQLLRNGICTVSSFRTDRYSKNHQLGYSFYLFAENLIKKYEILDGFGFDIAVLIFLYNLHKEAEEHKELKTRVEQTLRLLVLWNGRNEVKNQIVCNQNVYLSNLKNEIELNLSYIKELSSRQYNQLSELYSSESPQQNFLMCKTLISQLNTSVSTSAENTHNFQHNQVNKVTNTVASGKTIKPYSLLNSFRTMLESVVNISHMASNRELFYSSVKNQLITNFLGKKVGDIKSLENVVQQLTGGSSIQNQYSAYVTRPAELTYNISQTSDERTFLSNVNVDEINKYYSSLSAGTRVFSTLEERKQLLTRLLSVSAQNTVDGASYYVQSQIAGSNEYHSLSDGERQIINILSSVNYRELSAISSNIPSDILSSANTFSTVNNISPTNTSETEIVNNISRSTNVLQSALMTRERVLEYLQNTDDGEFDVISQKIVELLNIREYATLQGLTERLFSQEHSREISQLITSRKRLSREVVPLLREMSFTKNELLRTIESGTREEKVLTLSALSFATENIANIHMNDSRFESITNAISAAITHISTQSGGKVSKFGSSVDTQKIDNKSRQEPFNINLLNSFADLSKYSTIRQWTGTKRNVFQNDNSYGGDMRINQPGSTLITNLPLTKKYIQASHSNKITILETEALSSVTENNVLLAAISKQNDLNSVTEQYRATAELLYPKTEKDAPAMGVQASSVRAVNAVGQSNISIIKNISNMAMTQIINQAAGKLRGSMGIREQKSFIHYLTSHIKGNFMTFQGNSVARSDKITYYNSNIDNNGQEFTFFGNNADIVFYNMDKAQKKESQNTSLHTPSRSELISQFGNLIDDPNLPPSKLIGRQTDSILTGSANSMSIRELVEKLTLGEQTIKEEQYRVTELTQKLTEQEAAIYKLKHTHTQLQEDMAAGTNVKKITAMVMKELKAKMKLEKMRYGLQ